MSQKGKPFRVGRVSVYLRSRAWCLCFYEHGERRRIRAGLHREAARLLAAQAKAQLEAGAPSGLTFERTTIPELRNSWLEDLEHVRRASVGTIRERRSLAA